MRERPASVVHAVRSDSFAGVERYVCDVAGELSRRGWPVAVIGGDPPAMRAGLPPDVRHLPASTTRAVAEGLLRLRCRGITHVHMTAAEVAAVCTRPLVGGAIVSTRHFAQPRGQGGLVRTASRLLVGSLDCEIAISQYVSERLERQAVVLQNGVPDDHGTVDPLSRTILVMQRLQAEKDTETAVRAFAESGLADDGWLLRIAGRGALESQLRVLVEQLGLGRAVQLLGFVDRPSELRSRAAIFLATAPAEPFGLSLVEAMAVGLPVVAADGGAHAEVLSGTGLLYPPGDARACAVLLRRLAFSPQERADLGVRGRRRQREHLSVGTHVDRLEDVYQEVLSRSRR